MMYKEAVAFKRADARKRRAREPWLRKVFMRRARYPLRWWYYRLWRRTA